MFMRKFFPRSFAILFILVIATNSCSKDSGQPLSQTLSFSFSSIKYKYSVPQWDFHESYQEYQTIRIEDDAARPFGLIFMIQSASYFACVIYPHGVSVHGQTVVMGAGGITIDPVTTYDNGDPLDPNDVYFGNAGKISYTSTNCYDKEEKDNNGNPVTIHYCDMAGNFYLSAANGNNKTVSINDGSFVSSIQHQ